MALSTLFANATQATGAQLDTNFQEVGILGTFPCTAAGSNALVLAQGANTPTLGAYSNYLRFGFTAVSNCTGPTTARIGTLPVLNVYKDSTVGPVALVSADIVANNNYVLVYDSALNSGAGGFHLTVPSTATGATVSSVGLALPASLFGVSNSPVVSTGTLTATFTTISANSLLANASGSGAVPSIVSLSALMDSALGNTEGDMAYRASSLWTVLAPGAAGQQLSTGGASAVPSWGVTTSIGIAAAGSTTSLATVLTAAYNVIATVGAGTGVRIQSVANVPIRVNNEGANPLLVYPPIGGQFAALGANTPLTLNTLTVTELFGVSSSQFYKDY